MRERREARGGSAVQRGVGAWCARAVGVRHAGGVRRERLDAGGEDRRERTGKREHQPCTITTLKIAAATS